MCPGFSFAAYSPSAKQFKVSYCVMICFLNNQCFIGISRTAFPLPYKIRADLHWALTQDLSFQAIVALCGGVGGIQTGHLQEGRDQPGPRLGCVSPSLAELVATGLALRAGNGWRLLFLLTFHRVLNRAQLLVWVRQQHLSFHSCCLCSLWIFMQGQLSTASWKES